MSTGRLKLALAAALVVVAMFVVVAVTENLGRVVELAVSGEAPDELLTAIAVPVDAEDITWLEDGVLERALEPATRRAVAEAYLLSGAILDGAVRITDRDDLAVHLTGPALLAALEADGVVRVVARSHRIRAVFYSADGQLIELEDQTQRVFSIDSRLIVRHEQATAVLVQVDGVWHLRHRVVDHATAEVAEPASGLMSQHQQRGNS